VNYLLPTALRNAPAETRRQAELVVYAVVISTLVVLLTLGLLSALGHEGTAMSLAWVLPLQFLPLLLLVGSRKPKIAAHVFLMLLFFEIAYDFGPDDGFSVVAIVALPVAASALLGIVGGMIWTFIGVVWSGFLGPFVVRVADYSVPMSLSMAIVTLAVGVAAALNEYTRAQALLTASRLLRQLQRGRDAMRSFVEGAFPAHLETRGSVVVRASPAAAELLGYSVDELVGRNLREFVSADQFVEYLPRFRERPEPGIRVEVNVRSRSGEWLWLECFVVPVEADDGPRGEWPWIIGARDVREERKHRDRLIRAQRLESVGQLAAGVAHDFNNLLTVINGFAELLPAGVPRSNILRAATDAARLTADLMAFARNSPAADNCIDVAESIRSWRAVFESVCGERIKLNLDLANASCGAVISEGQLNQMLLNLVTNARDAMAQGGTLTIRLDHSEAAAALASQRGLKSTDQYVCIFVTDTGSGMDAETLERAFDPFFTTKPAGKGTGLGLASVYGIVKQRGGLVEIDSTPGLGSQVLVILKRDLQLRPTPASLNPSPGESAAPAHILVIEDNPQVNDLVTRALVTQGHVVQSCTDVDSARRWLISNRVDLLVSDIVLQGTLGTDFVMEVRSHDPELRVLFISGYSSIENGPWQTDDTGRSEFLAKPFAVSALLQHTARLLEHRLSRTERDGSVSADPVTDTEHHAYNTLN
jgi:PAS domain S-box-containing protein